MIMNGRVNLADVNPDLAKDCRKELGQPEDGCVTGSFINRAIHHNNNAKVVDTSDSGRYYNDLDKILILRV